MSGRTIFRTWPTQQTSGRHSMDTLRSPKRFQHHPCNPWKSVNPTLLSRIPRTAEQLVQDSVLQGLGMLPTSCHRYKIADQTSNCCPSTPHLTRAVLEPSCLPSGAIQREAAMIITLSKGFIPTCQLAFAVHQMMLCLYGKQYTQHTLSQSCCHMLPRP